MKKYYITSLIIVLLISLSFYYFSTNHEEKKFMSNNKIVMNESKVVDRIPPKGYSLYKNIDYRFSLFYPDMLINSLKKEGQGASTIVFQDIKTQKGLQIFIVPYQKDMISPERFKMDVPSGVRLDEKIITIDGIMATTFYSKDSVLGDVYEIWFIRDGFLYEITTIKDLQNWLHNILDSWKFI